MKMMRTRIVSYEEEVPDSLEEFKGWRFSSGGTTGEDFIVFARKFKGFIKENMPDGSVLVDFSRGHYSLNGFIGRGGRFVYFSISDVRFFKNEWAENILIRTAKSEQDYTGGSNGFTSLKDFRERVHSLLTGGVNHADQKV